MKKEGEGGGGARAILDTERYMDIGKSSLSPSHVRLLAYLTTLNFFSTISRSRWLAWPEPGNRDPERKGRGRGRGRQACTLGSQLSVSAAAELERTCACVQGVDKEIKCTSVEVINVYGPQAAIYIHKSTGRPFTSMRHRHAASGVKMCACVPKKEREAYRAQRALKKGRSCRSCTSVRLDRGHTRHRGIDLGE
jgi:hypothetical protein